MNKVCPYCKLGQHEDCLQNQGKECECEECNGPIDEKPIERFVYGLDPASKNDYFGIVVHAVPAYDPRIPYVPELRTVRNLTHIPFDRMFDVLRNDMFPRYPPAQIVTDYTNEKTFTEMLIRDYGEYRVEAIRFSMENKKMLKDDGYSIIKQGYKFPNPNKIKDKRIAEWVSELMNQLLREQLIITGSGKETFGKPTGEHNDLATAWELSIHGCLKMILRKGAQPLVATADPDIERMSAYDDAEELFPELEKYSHVDSTLKNP